MKQEVPLMHLYWRAGFGCSPREWQAKQQLSIPAAVEELFEQAARAKPLSEEGLLLSTKPRKSLSNAEKQALRKQERQLLADTNAAWIKRMADPHESALLERMSLFWHGHFACENKHPLLAVRQLNALRKYALGNFKDLLLAITRDPSMIRYLNNQQNKKLAPNENFARELLELFTIGIGHYSEQDIKEAARAFTGWSSNQRGEFVFRERQHDFGEKIFMGKTGVFDGEDIIDILLEQRQTATFIATKIYRYFVNETLDETRIQQLAQQFYDSNYDIGGLMRTIFTSDWFYESQNIGTKIKSPVELMAGLVSSLNVQGLETSALIGIQRRLGQILFKPPNVAGWKGGKTWIDNATLLLRLNLVEALGKAAKVRTRQAGNDEMMGNRKTANIPATIDVSYLIERLKDASELEIYEDLRTYFLPTFEDLNQAKILPFTDKTDRESYIKSLILRLMSLPEYQLC